MTVTTGEDEFPVDWNLTGRRTVVTWYGSLGVGRVASPRRGDDFQYPSVHIPDVGDSVTHHSVSANQWCTCGTPVVCHRLAPFDLAALRPIAATANLYTSCEALVPCRPSAFHCFGLSYSMYPPKSEGQKQSR